MNIYDEFTDDPYADTGCTPYRPGDEITRQLVLVRSRYRDVVERVAIWRESKSEYRKKLMLKDIIVDLFSIDDNIRPLCNRVLSPNFSFSDKIDDTSKKKFGSYYRTYCRLFTLKKKLLRDIRNGIGAHLELRVYDRHSELWNKITDKDLKEILSSIPPLFNFLKDLDVYTWVKVLSERKGEEIIAISQPLSDWQI